MSTGSGIALDPFLFIRYILYVLPGVSYLWWYIAPVLGKVGVSYSGIIRASGARNQSSILCTPTLPGTNTNACALVLLSRCVEPTCEFDSLHPDQCFKQGP